jgi:hypothetical protein
MVDALLVRARGLWSELVGVPVAWPAAGGVAVVTSAHSMLCPPGWVGIVVLGEAALVTTPVDAGGDDAAVRRALAGLPVGAIGDPARVGAAVPVAEVLGPATLAYCDDRAFRPVHTGAVEEIDRHHHDLGPLLASVTGDEAGESGLDGITSPAFVVRSRDHVVAAAGTAAGPTEPLTCRS